MLILIDDIVDGLNIPTLSHTQSLTHSITHSSNHTLTLSHTNCQPKSLSNFLNNDFLGYIQKSVFTYDLEENACS